MPPPSSRTGFASGAGWARVGDGARHRGRASGLAATREGGKWISGSLARRRSSPAAARASAGRSPTTLAAEGCHVAICARSAAAWRAPSRRSQGKGVKAFGQALDVTDRAALVGWVEASAAALGGIDIAVANVSALDMNRTDEAFIARVPGRPAAHRAHGRRRAAAPRALGGRRHRRDLERLGPRARLHEPGLRHLQGGADPLRLAHGERARAQAHPGQRRLARQHLFRGRHLAAHRAQPARPVQGGARPRTPGAAWRPTRRSRTPRCSSRARPRASPPASTSWSTAR